MLRIQKYTNYNERDAVFAEHDPNASTWVVSDLQSKLDLQKHLLIDRDFLEEDSVLRVNELWQKLLVRYLPHYRVIPKDLATSVCRECLGGIDEDWIQRSGVAQLLFAYVRQLMPLLAHPNGREVLKAWFAEKPESAEKWKKWADLSYLVWTEFNERRLLAPDWVSAALLNSQINDLVWDKDITVDLGGNLSSVELELFRKLAENRSVTLLIPTPEFLARYRETLVSYRSWLDEVEVEPNVKQAPSQIEYLRFSTMLAEVKNAVARVRIWSEQGVKFSDIALISPDIESYWFALKDHLACEGIPVYKKTVGRLQTLPSVQAWLAEIRLRRKRLSREDLETRVFSENVEQRISYEQFERLFKNTYHDHDITRSKELARLYEDAIDETKRFSHEEFIAWILLQWAHPEDIEPLELIVQKLNAEIPHGLSLSLFEWCNYLESHLSRIEFELEPARPDGIFCNNLSAANHSHCTHRIYLGSTEAALVRESHSALSMSDVLSLAEQTGFQLAFPDSKQALFEMEMQVCTSNGHQVVMSFPETNFGGAVQAPSIVWLEGRTARGDAEDRNLPKPTRLDSLLHRFSSEQKGNMDPRLSCEVSDESIAPFASSKVVSLSATSLERYKECPFRFAAEKIFGLSDLPSLDLDIDRMTRGALLHKVFEKVLPMDRTNFRIADKELHDIVDLAFKECETQLVDERLWPPLREKYVVLAKRFLEFEAKWQEQFPQTQTVGREEKVRGYLTVESAEFASDPPPEPSFQFRGSIDRIDSDGAGNYVILDYKSSQGSLRQYTSWRKNGQYQMALYAMAFEKGLTSMASGEVLAGLYYAVKEMNRNTGFLVNDHGEALFPLAGRARNKISSEEKQNFFLEMREDIKGLTQAIHNGEFAPIPEDTKTCQQCRWKKLCRAPHLR